MKDPEASSRAGAGKGNTFEGKSPFTLSNQLARLLFGVVWLIFARLSPPQARKWRVMILRAFGADVAWTANVYGSARIWLPSNLTMAHQAVVGPRAIIYCMAPVRLGQRAIVSQGSHLCCGTHAYNDPAFPLYARPITIHAHAWVCAEAFVGPGVEVGKGAVLGARAVAMKDLDEWTVYSGNPATKMAMRRNFDQGDL